MLSPILLHVLFEMFVAPALAAHLKGRVRGEPVIGLELLEGCVRGVPCEQLEHGGLEGSVFGGLAKVPIFWQLLRTVTEVTSLGLTFLHLSI